MVIVRNLPPHLIELRLFYVSTFVYTEAEAFLRHHVAFVILACYITVVPYLICQMVRCLCSIALHDALRTRVLSFCPDDATQLGA